MFLINCSFLLLSLSTKGVFLSRVSDAFGDANIISETNIKPPEKMLQVTYGDNAVVDLGNELILPQIQVQPRFTFDGNPDLYYTLIMIDMDGPKKSGQFLQWMTSNIETSDMENSGDTNYPYRPPVPTPCDKPHRYTFLLYEHKHKLDFDLNDIEKTASLLPVIDIKEFANENQLGEPKYGNYYNGVFDTNVQQMCQDTGISLDTSKIPLFSMQN